MGRAPCGSSCPGRRFAEILTITVGLLRRYGAAEPNVVQALLRLLATCAELAIEDPRRWSAIEEQARLLVADAERTIGQSDDLATVHAQADNVNRVLNDRQAGRVPRWIVRPPDRRFGSGARPRS